MSDNGPWIEMPPRMLQKGNEKWHAGSTGLLRGSKASTYEGGPRVPAIIRWPGEVEPGQVKPDLVGMPDIYRTMLGVGGAKLSDLKLDGYDLIAFLSGTADASPRSEYYYFKSGLEAVRSGDWKLRTTSGESELFNLVTDPSERLNRATELPEKVSELRSLMEKVAEETGTRIAGG